MTVSKKIGSHAVATAAAMAVAVALSGPVAAKEVTVRHQILSEDQLVERVSYADLNLASANDVKRLTYRVRGAVNHVCSPHYDRATFAEYGECKTYAWSGARPQMDLAIQRAQQIALTGVSAIAPVAILISVPQK